MYIYIFLISFVWKTLISLKKKILFDAKYRHYEYEDVSVNYVFLYRNSITTISLHAINNVVRIVGLSGLSHSLENLLVMNRELSQHELERKVARSPSACSLNYFRRDQSYVEPIIKLISVSFIVITLSCKISSWWLLSFPMTQALMVSSLVDFVCSSGLRLVSRAGKPLSASPSLRYSRPPRPCVAAYCTYDWFHSRYSKWPYIATPAKTQEKSQHNLHEWKSTMSCSIHHS